ncbi:hypothetical protein [Stieleria varia]|uniref:Uncharacterized protein n=1 Tax=Stieleria varia TaxID=2528005 RepID=A0A5C6B553_9BACT|nr:hypothetical protein [Stieleria varia]TWU06406.1 hypothetical protein Pla52n_21270 [Stieleria varia]
MIENKDHAPRYRPVQATAIGCFFALVVAFVTAVLLLLNGSLVLALLNRVAKDLPMWMRRPGFLQFALFSLPVVLVVLEWILFDYLRSLFRKREMDTEG